MKIPKSKWLDPNKVKIPYDSFVIGFIKNPQFGCEHVQKKGTVTLIVRRDIDECFDIVSYLKLPVSDVYRWQELPKAPKNFKHLEAEKENELVQIKHPLHLWLDKIEKNPDRFIDKLYQLTDKYRSPCWLLSDLIRGEGQMLQFLSEDWGSIDGWKKRYKKYWNQFLR